VNYIPIFWAMLYPGREVLGIRNISNLRKNISLDTRTVQHRAISYGRLSETCKGSHQVSNK